MMENMMENVLNLKVKLSLLKVCSFKKKQIPGAFHSFVLPRQLAAISATSVSHQYKSLAQVV